jgi:uncharacterized protein (TIGR03435 family)
MIRISLRCGRLVSVASSVALVGILSAQTFEVASIKPNTSDDLRSSAKLTPGELFIENVSLQKCIALAYNVSEDRDGAIVAPGWVRETRFDITARLPGGTQPEQARVMLQNLLTERFKLKLHHESREARIYALLLAKNGPKLHESGPDVRHSMRQGPGRLTGMRATLSEVADHLSGPLYQLGRQVIDQTGLKGNYDFTLEWAPSDQDTQGPSLFTALQEQLGLRLEARKASVDVLVVDSMEKTPTEN